VHRLAAKNFLRELILKKIKEKAFKEKKTKREEK